MNIFKLTALLTTERHKEPFKTGKRAPRMLADIAAKIRYAYAQGAYKLCDDDTIRFDIGSLSVTCRNRPGAVELVACKYERGLPRRNARRTT